MSLPSTWSGNQGTLLVNANIVQSSVTNIAGQVASSGGKGLPLVEWNFTPKTDVVVSRNSQLGPFEAVIGTWITCSGDATIELDFNKLPWLAAQFNLATYNYSSFNAQTQSGAIFNYVALLMVLKQGGVDTFDGYAFQVPSALITGTPFRLNRGAIMQWKINWRGNGAFVPYPQ